MSVPTRREDSSVLMSLSIEDSRDPKRALREAHNGLGLPYHDMIQIELN